ALQPWRLAGGVALAIAVFVSWLIVRHGLWERRTATPRAGLHNSAMLLTLLNGVVLFSVALFAINTTLAVVMVPPDYVSQIVGESGGWPGYLRVPLMATVLGILAGAVGSGLENHQTVREAAFSQREQERRKLAR
ncbi:MAG TPA: hypothetical protein VHH34_03645, partial [Pseudonocardiaceae bacterium]|nr:hypothetical protein [Pseudonocardiaceae bacterium]